MKYFKEWLAELGIDSEVDHDGEQQADQRHPRRQFDMFQWGWFVEPDPDSMLSYMTCGQRGGWSDSWYCNPEYDELYAQQNAATDLAQREETVKQMQQILFDDSPYLVTAYNTIGEAYRSDRFDCFQPQPDPGGIAAVPVRHPELPRIRRADDAGDCDGVERAGRAGGRGWRRRRERAARRSGRRGRRCWSCWCRRRRLGLRRRHSADRE